MRNLDSTFYSNNQKKKITEGSGQALSVTRLRTVKEVKAQDNEFVLSTLREPGEYRQPSELLQDPTNVAKCQGKKL